MSWAATAIGGRCSMSQTERQSWDLGGSQTGRFYFLEFMKLHHKMMDEYENSFLCFDNPAFERQQTLSLL